SIFKTLLLAGTMLSISANAQTSTALTLKECIEYGLKNHRSNTIYTNKVSIAKYKATEALSAYLPQVNGTVTFDDNVKLQTTLIPAGAFSPEPTKIQMGNPYASNVTARVDQAIYDPTLIANLK